MTDIAHDRTSHRFTTEVDGHTGYVEYQRADGVMVITHTIVPSAIGGRGIAGDLVRAAVEYAKGHGLKVDPQCSHADGWIRKHPEYQALRA
jgi:predicted GNAT family acetyltransferase